MLGELTLWGAIRKPKEKRWGTTFWHDTMVRVNHNPRMTPIGTVASAVHRPDGDLEVTLDIVPSAHSLLTLTACQWLGFGARLNGELMELVEVSVIDHPVTTPKEKRNPWMITGGRLPRVLVEWFTLRRLSGSDKIERFEVGWSVHGDLCEVKPQFAIDDHTAYQELLRNRFVI